MAKLAGKIFVLTLLVFYLSLALTAVVFAQEETYEPPVIQVNIGEIDRSAVFSAPAGAQCPEGISGQSCISIAWMSEYFNLIYRYGTGLAGILAAIVILVAGFLWLMSAGSPDRISTAKELIVGALSGLALALMSYLILTTINPALVENKALVVQKMSPPASQAAVPGCCVTAGGSGAGASVGCVQSKDLSNCTPSRNMSAGGTSGVVVTPYANTDCLTIEICKTRGAAIVDQMNEPLGCCKTTTIGMGGTGVTCEEYWDASACVSPQSLPGARGMTKKEPFSGIDCADVAGCE